jgi:hypothetical protein
VLGILHQRAAGKGFNIIVGPNFRAGLDNYVAEGFLPVRGIGGSAQRSKSPLQRETAIWNPIPYCWIISNSHPLWLDHFLDSCGQTAARKGFLRGLASGWGFNSVAGGFLPCSAGHWETQFSKKVLRRGEGAVFINSSVRFLPCSGWNGGRWCDRKNPYSQCLVRWWATHIHNEECPPALSTTRGTLHSRSRVPNICDSFWRDIQKVIDGLPQNRIS